MRFLSFICLLFIPAALRAAPAVTVLTPSAGATVSSLTTLSVTFNEAVSGVEAEDLQINAENAASVTGTGAGPYVFSFTQPPPGLVSVSWDFDNGIAAEAGTGALDPGAGWTYTLTDTIAPSVAKLRTSVAGQEMDAIMPAPGSTAGILTAASVAFDEIVTGVNAADLLINNSPAATVTGDGAGPYTFTFPAPADGTVNFTWSGAPGILDSAGNPFAGSGWTVTKAASAGTVRITEFLAANSNTAMAPDENGDTSDWIELTNTGATGVNLTGWTLTSDDVKFDQWVFPARTLAAGARILVYASGKDRKPAAGNLHTNFSLNATGGYLALFPPDNPATAATVFASYPEQRYNVSFGTLSGGGEAYFSPPNPNAANPGTGLSAVTPAPTASVGRGFFNEPFALVWSCADAAATIRYTLDGSEPVAASPAYSGPLTINTTTVLRASAFNPAKVPSSSVTHSYLFLDHVLNQAGPPYDNPNNTTDNTNPPLPTVSSVPGGAAFPVTWGTNATASYAFPGMITNLTTGQIPADYGMDPEIVTDPARYNDNGVVDAAGLTNAERVRKALREMPLLSIVMKNSDMFGNGTGIYMEPLVRNKGPSYERPCSVELLMPDGTTGFVSTCGIRIHGNASREPWKNPKHGFKLNFKGTYGANELVYALFPDTPVHEFEDLILRADFNSGWCHWDSGQRSRGTRLRDAFSKHTFRDMGRAAGHHRYVHLFINGLYWGTYDPTEQENNGFAASTFGGGKDDYDVYDQGALKSGTATTYNAMLAIAAPIDNPKYEQMKQYLDVPWYIDYILLHFYLGHQDWGDDLNKNWYAARNNKNGGKFKYLPWDMENLMWEPTVNRVSVAAPASGLHPKLNGNAQYKLDFADRVHHHMVNPGGALLPAANLARWAQWRAVIQNAIGCESARWGDYRRDVHPYQGGPYPLYKWNVDWMAEVNRLKNVYFPARTTNVLAQLRAATLYPTLNAPEFRNNTDNALTGDQRIAAGYQLKMVLPTPPPAGTTSAGTIYFTTDGTDPRVTYTTTGQLSASAQTYSAPVSIATTTAVKARALNGTTWSALMEATFTMGSPIPAVRITEIHYNPRSAHGGSAAEFIELQNTGVMAVDLSGWSLDGLDFVFPFGLTIGPSDRMVLASNNAPATFAAQYPGVAVTATFGGSLNNAGERLTLRDRDGVIVCTVEYDDTIPWPAAADGGGPSLEVVDPAGDLQSPANWQASALSKGTPGAVNSVPAVPPVVINEFLAANAGAYTSGGATPDFLELKNTGASAVGVSGWVVSYGNPAVTITLPAESIAPSGFLLVHFHATPLAGITFPAAMADTGGTIGLATAGGARVDGVRYGPQASNLSFSRSGNTWQLTAPTPGSANASAVTSAPLTSLKLNEFLADPAPGEDDWLELRNTSAALPVVLTGLHAGAAPELQRMAVPAAIAPDRHARLFCDTGAQNGDVLNFPLPARGTVLTLGDAAGDVFETTSYGAQTQAVSEGRLPDGTGTVAPLPFPSPGQPNYAALSGTPLINEVLVRNEDGDNAPWARRPAWVEVRNPAVSSLDLSGWRLRTAAGAPSWTFPAGVALPPGGIVGIWCDPLQPASIAPGAHLNAALPLDATYAASGLELTNPAGQIADRITWGAQLADQSIGRTAAESWALLQTPTRGRPNSEAQGTESVASLRLNEWMADDTVTGTRRFLELYNTGAAPAALSGLWLGDEPSETGRRKWQVPALTFLGAHKHLELRPLDATTHPLFFSFDLSAGGEYLRLSANDSAVTAIDAVNYGRSADPAQSQGRLPDGTAAIGVLVPTPGWPNSSTGAGPFISIQPRGFAAPAGQSARLSIEAPSALSFQWKRDGIDIAGATGSNLDFGALTRNDDATYTCVAANASGSTLSAPARLIVLYTYAAWAAENGAGPGTSDPDRDALNNFAEFLAGTNPLVAATALERLAVHQSGARETSGGIDYLTMDLLLSRRAAFGDLKGELSPALQSWSARLPDVSQTLSVEPNGDPHLRLKFALPAGNSRQFLRLRIEP